MENTIIITMNPVNIPPTSYPALETELKQQIAIQDLESTRLYILRTLKHYIPINFSAPIHLHLSYNARTMLVKVDYSKVKNQKARNLIQCYLNGETKAFSKAWLSL